MQTLALKSTQLIISWHFSGGRREKDTTHFDTQLLELSPRRQKKLHLLSHSCWAVRARKSTSPNPHLLGCSLQSGKLQSHAVDYARTIFLQPEQVGNSCWISQRGDGERRQITRWKVCDVSCDSTSRQGVFRVLSQL